MSSSLYSLASILPYSAIPIGRSHERARAIKHQDQPLELKFADNLDAELRDQVAEIRRARESDFAKHDAIAAEMAEIGRAVAVNLKGENQNG